MSTESPTQPPVTPPPAPPSEGEFGKFLKSKGISSIPLGNDSDKVEMIELDAKDLVNACKLLKDSKESDFNFLVLLTSTDTKKGYQSIYTLQSLNTKKSLRIKVTVSRDNPKVPSVSHIWGTANWYERESFDMMGIVYTDHPYLKRILNPENWEGYPLRKDYIPPVDLLNGPHPLTETGYAEKTLGKQTS